MRTLLFLKNAAFHSTRDHEMVITSSQLANGTHIYLRSSVSSSWHHCNVALQLTFQLISSILAIGMLNLLFFELRLWNSNSSSNLFCCTRWSSLITQHTGGSVNACMATLASQHWSSRIGLHHRCSLPTFVTGLYLLNFRQELIFLPRIVVEYKFYVASQQLILHCIPHAKTWSTDNIVCV